MLQIWYAGNGSMSLYSSLSSQTQLLLIVDPMTLDSGPAHLICIAGLVHMCNNIITPTFPGVFLHITCQLGIAFIKKPLDSSGLPFKHPGCTVENVATATLNMASESDQLQASFGHATVSMCQDPMYHMPYTIPSCCL